MVGVGSIVLAAVAAYLVGAPGPEPASPLRKLAPAAVLAEVDEVTRELARKHPGFYRYNSRPAFRAYIDSVKATITDSLNTVEAFRKLKPIVSKIGCLHTQLALSPAHRQYLDQRPNLFPFQLYFRGERAFVVRNYSGNAAIRPGDEVLSINGRSMARIVRELLPAIPSDGHNLTLKYRALYYQFPVWYRNMLDVTTDFGVAVRQQGEERRYAVPGTTFDQMAGNGFLREPVPAQQLTFRVQDGVGRLGIHSFAASDIKRSKQHFRAFIDAAFATLNAQRVPHLVIDLRDNTGGTDPNAVYLARYLFDRPFRYWDRIEVTAAIAGEIKGMNALYYRKPVRQDSLWLWPKSRATREFDFYQVQQPVAAPYRGRVYVLINGFCMSACADLTAVLSANRRAVFVGEETGGGYQGNNSGMLPRVTLPLLGFELTVPVQKYVNAVEPGRNLGRGTMPEYPVELTVAEVLSGEDKVLNQALALIRQAEK